MGVFNDTTKSTFVLLLVVGIHIVGICRAQPQAQDPDGCSSDPNVCSPFANCTIRGDYCTCNDGYEGNGTICTDVDECYNGTDSCSDYAYCTNTEGSYNCSCWFGLIGDGYNCTDTDECADEPCNDHADCYDFFGIHYCFCQVGYSGDGVTSCTDIDECNYDDPSVCSEYADCTNTGGSYNCSCWSGYTGDGYSCTEIDACSKGTDLCTPFADCLPNGETYYCVCKDGYTGDGDICTDIDECSRKTDLCSDYADCTNTLGSYDCICWTGFTGGGYTCTDIDPCPLDIQQLLCSQFARCTNNNREHVCICDIGYEGSGTTCTDIDECSHDVCSSFADCTNTKGAYQCTCRYGYIGNGHYCEDLEKPSLWNCVDVRVSIDDPDVPIQVYWDPPIANDNAGIPTLSSSSNPGDFFTVGNTNVTYWATDDYGNVASCQFTVRIFDYYSNFITHSKEEFIPGNHETEIWLVITEKDCLFLSIDETRWESVTYCISVSSCTLSTGSIYHSDTSTRPNPDCIFYERIVDRTPPSFYNCPWDQREMTETGKDYAIVTWNEPYVYDDFDLERTGIYPNVSSSFKSGDHFPIGVTNVTYVAKDFHQNKGVCYFLVNVYDNEIPMFKDCPSTLYYGTVQSSKRYVKWKDPTATDNAGKVTVKASVDLPVLLSSGLHDVEYTATDKSNNTATCRFVVSVEVVEDFVDDLKINILMNIANADYSSELAERSTTKFFELATRVEVAMSELFWGPGKTYEGEPYRMTVIRHFSAAGDKGLATNFTWIFASELDEDSKLEALRLMYSEIQLKSLGDLAIGSDLQVHEHDGSISNVTWCYLKPCEEDMECTILESKCIANCEKNPNYCMNGGTCFINSNDLVSCSCLASEYYGKRCEYKFEAVSNAQLIAICSSIGWLCVFAIMGFILFVVYTNKNCKLKKKASNYVKTSDLEMIQNMGMSPGQSQTSLYASAVGDDPNKGVTERNGDEIEKGVDNPVYSEFSLSSGSEDGNVQYRSIMTS
ncbi:uncharacterized protein LOC144442366 [Glandiceps talaboti]